MGGFGWQDGQKAQSLRGSAKRFRSARPPMVAESLLVTGSRGLNEYGSFVMRTSRGRTRHSIPNDLRAGVRGAMAHADMRAVGVRPNPMATARIGASGHSAGGRIPRWPGWFSHGSPPRVTRTSSTRTSDLSDQQRQDSAGVISAVDSPMCTNCKWGAPEWGRFQG